MLNRKHRRFHRGFTLFEVLIALAIMAIALSALLRAAGVAADNSRAMRLKMQAGWEAQNRLNLVRATQQWPDTGVQSGMFQEGNIEWHWLQTVTVTSRADIRRVTVKMMSAETGADYVLGASSEYIRRPSSTDSP